MEVDIIKSRHALLLVFEYRLDGIRAKGGVPIEPPGPLLAMNTDLTVAYHLATQHFGIDRKNITVVTDVVPPYGQARPWDPLVSSGENPRIVQLPYPEITGIVREIAQFIENTIRGIDDTVSKGHVITNEVFIYVSCHGAQIPTIPSEVGELDPMDNALIFITKREGKYYERRYLRANDIFKLFFGHNIVSEEGIMTVPITRRSRVTSMVDGKSIQHYVFEDDEVCRIRLTPIKALEPRSTRLEYRNPLMRGLPITTNMLVLFDTCHSGSMADFHYVYDPIDCEMKPTANLPCGYEYPFCVSLAASEDSSDAPSTSNGSPFTRCVFNIFKEAKCGLSIRQFHEMIYKTMPRLLQSCKPTICATVCNHDSVIPFLTRLYPCEVPEDKSRHRSTTYGSILRLEAACTLAEDQE